MLSDFNVLWAAELNGATRVCGRLHHGAALFTRDLQPVCDSRETSVMITRMAEAVRPGIAVLACSDFSACACIATFQF